MKRKLVEITIKNYDIMSYVPMQVYCAFCAKNNQCAGFDACPIVRTAHTLEPQKTTVRQDDNCMHIIIPAYNKQVFKRFCKTMSDAVDACIHSGHQK